MEQILDNMLSDQDKSARQQFAEMMTNKTAIVAGASKYAPSRDGLSVTPGNFACPIAS